MVDPHQLENALLNLCLNARDAMPAGGRLTIETANVAGPDEGAVPPPGGSIGDHVSLRVSDTGVGMTPEVKARAFDPFFTTKPIGQGTGLGLSMIHGFARQSGGDARIDSRVGEGTTVILRLPRHQGNVAAIDTPLAFAPAPSAGVQGTVLVIDDEAPIRTLLVDMLGAVGRRALEAHDGPSGLATLRATQGIELVIADLGLPGGMTGRQVAAAARLVRPGLKVLYITGHEAITSTTPKSGEPDAPVLTKPFTLETLTRQVRVLLDGA
jgi:CheY-like chemotaxis protein